MIAIEVSDESLLRVWVSPIHLHTHILNLTSFKPSHVLSRIFKKSSNRSTISFPAIDYYGGFLLNEEIEEFQVLLEFPSWQVFQEFEVYREFEENQLHSISGLPFY